MLVELARRMLDSSIISGFWGVDADLMAFNQLRDFIGDQLKSRPQTEHEFLQFVRHLREEKWIASSLDNLQFSFKGKIFI